MMPEIKEEHTTMVANHMCQAGDADSFANLGGAEFAAFMSSVTVHGNPDIVARAGKSVNARRLRLSLCLPCGQPSPVSAAVPRAAIPKNAEKTKLSARRHGGDKATKLRY